MATSKKPRKPMKKRPTLLLPMSWRHSDKGAIDITIKPHAALIKLREGDTSLEVIAALWTRLLWTLLSLQKYFPASLEAINDVNSALNLLKVLDARGSSEEPFVLAQEEAETIGHALTIADEVEKNTTRRESLDTLNEAVKRLKKNKS